MNILNPKNSILHATVLAVACCLLPMRAHAIFEDNELRLKFKELAAFVKELNKNSEKLDDKLKALSTRLDQLKTDVNKSIKDEVGNSEEKLSQRIDAKADDKKLNAFFAEMETLRHKLNDEIADLRGRVEILANETSASQKKVDKLSNDLANALKRQTELYEDTSKRLSKIEPRYVIIDGIEVEVTQSEQKQFDEANALFKKKDFVRATQAFTAFLQRFPGSGFAPESHYSLAISYMAEGDCKNAVPALQTVINRYTWAQKTPDAMLKLAICQDDLGDQSLAQGTMEALIKKYPDSPAAKTARAKLNALK